MYLSSRGLTLIEALMTIAIVAILAVIATPSFLSFIENRRLIGTMDNLYYALLYAKSEAIKTNKTVFVHFQTGDQWCYGMNVLTACDCNVASTCTLKREQFNKAQELSLSLTGSPSTLLQFEPIKGALNSGATITMTLYGQTKSLSLKIGRLGNMKFCSSTMSGYPSCT